MKKIAITGGIGSGKSLVGSYLKKQGYPVYSCDEIYKEIFDKEEYVCLIARVFPNVVKNNKIDKHLLSKIVFEDKGQLDVLNSIAHPYVLKILENKMNNTVAPLVFAEVPLLFEGKYETLFDGVIVVFREKNARVSAVRQRDGLSEQEILARMNNQFDYDQHYLFLKEKYRYIENNGDKFALYDAVDFLLKELS